MLADWIASKDNPLTARVIVNRVWQYHFGRGIVPIAEQLRQARRAADAPRAARLAAPRVHGRRLEAQAPPQAHHDVEHLPAVVARATPANLKADPANKLFWRFNMRRLTAEEVRDSILAVSGSSNLKQTARASTRRSPKEVLAGQSVPGQGLADIAARARRNRRSVYVHVKRSLQVPILIELRPGRPRSAARCATRRRCRRRRSACSTASSPTSRRRPSPSGCGRRPPNDLAAQVTRAIRLTTGRVPAADEVKKDVAFIAALKEKHKLDDAAALTQYCLLCLNTNEFVYLD